MATEQTPLIHEDQPVSASVEKRTPLGVSVIRYATALLFVFATGVAAWALDQRMHRSADRSKPEEVFEWKSQILGWASAVLFRKLNYISIDLHFLILESTPSQCQDPPDSCVIFLDLALIAN